MTTRRAFLKHLGAGFAGLAAAGLGRSAAAAATLTTPAPAPNFVFFLIDDMGWRDLACYGSTFYETPHIDRLCSQGMKFTSAYAACPVCSPTRASVMTGKYPARLHVTDWIAGHNRPLAKLRIPDWTKYLPLEEVTLAEALKPAGYATASIGKWHLGTEEYWPEKQGFDVNLAGCHMGQPPAYFAPYKIPTLTEGPVGEYLTDRLADEALTFIDKNKDRPFFLYLPNYAVHTPLQAKKEVVAKYQAKVRPDNPQNNATYAAMVESVDDGVGKVLAKLDALGLADRTVVVFTSDNGGLMRSTSNAPLRDGKGTFYEGGIREPLIVRWPEAVKPGSVCDEVVSSIDFFPTLAEIAGIPLQTTGAKDLDGVSFVPLLRQTATLRREAIYWHYPHYHPCGATPGGIIRAGDWKLIETFEDGRVELYNLRDDLGEAKDLAAAMPDRAAALRQRLADWRKSVGAQMPTPNPDYDAVKNAAPKGGAKAGKAKKK